MDTRFTKILKSVAELDEDFTITVDQNLQGDLEIDSLRMIDIVLNVEREFDVELSEEALISAETVGQLWAEVSQAVAA
ncbi:acyl carrier protein [Amycolatopsis sp. NPDC052450]|uniref:acyl carrier protein n=1 Tax=Amycolatopsis sp. NPDC052450 TaxID=3363937 RepID=UPI0037C9E64F